MKGKTYLCCPSCGGKLTQTMSKQLRCSRCDATYGKLSGIWSFLDTSPQYQWKDFFEDKAASGKVTAETVAYMSRKNFDLIKKGFSHFIPENTKSKFILDAGCGHGGFSKEWAKKNHMIGVDFSLNMLKLAQKNGLEVYQADVAKLPFADDQFDIVLAAEVIQHVEPVSDFLRELVRVLRPKGRLVISGLNAHSWVRRLNRSFLKPLFNSQQKPPPLRSLPDLISKLDGLGCKQLSVVTTYYPFCVWRKNAKVSGLNLRLASNFIIGTEKNIGDSPC